jgi:hypothetical protein
MKTHLFRVWALGVAGAVLVLGTGCQQQEARAEVPEVDRIVPEIAVEPTPPAIEVAGGVALEKTNISTNIAAPKLVQNPVTPPDLKASPALEEVLKLAQAGVSQEVMMAYITSSTTFFNVTSDAIVYLNDLGVANDVITALIQHDATPEMQARKQMANAVQPLPPGVVLNNPATNIYPPPVAQTPAVATAPPAPTETQVVGVPEPVEQPDNVSSFYSSLAPYGTWIDVEGYGRCWQPTVVVSNPGWSPYCDRGRWVWSDYGWYWYSDYTWGWAPFHYGRWANYPRLGWIWAPDTCWGPSWVSWRYSSAYCGWAPLPPGCDYRHGSFYRGGVRIGLAFDDVGLGILGLYNFVPTRNFCDRSVGLHVIRGDRVRGIHNQTTVVNNFINGNNNTIINNGIPRDRVATATRGQIPTATVRTTATTANNRREQLVNNGSSMAIVRPSLPAAPERSHVRIPTRPITRVSASDPAPTVPNSSGRFGTPATPSSPEPGRRIGAVERPSPSATQPRTAAVQTRPSGAEPRDNVPSNNQGSRSPTVTSSRDSSASAPTRPNSSGFRNYSAPTTGGNNSGAQAENRVAVNNAPSVVTTPARPEARPQVNSAPASRPMVPNSAARTDSGIASRPSTQLPPNVSRPAPSVSAPTARPNFAPSPAAPSYSAPASRPEPSRAMPSYSAPARSFATPAPSYSAPAHSAPSASAPSYSAPSHSAPSTPNRSGSFSSGGNSGGGSRGGGGGGRGRE